MHDRVDLFGIQDVAEQVSTLNVAFDELQHTFFAELVGMQPTLCSFRSAPVCIMPEYKFNYSLP